MFAKLFKPNIKKMVQKTDLEGLRKVLKGENYSNRQKFFEVVSNLEVEQAVSLLKDTLADMWPTDRKRAIIFLGEKKNPNAIESLIEYLEYDQAINALVNIGPSSVEQLINLLHKECKYHRDSQIKGHAIEALGIIKDDRATSHLIKIAKEPVDSFTTSAIKALGMIGSAECIEFLIQLLRSADEYKQREAYIAICRVGSDKATEPLLNELSLIEDDPDLQKPINSLLIQIGDSRAIQNIINLLNSNNKKIHSESIEALKRIKWEPQSNEQKIWKLSLKHKWDEVKKFNKLALIPAIRLLVNDDKYLRKGAAEVLGEIADARSVEFLINGLRDKDINKLARDSLVKLKEISIEPLISSLDSKSKNYSEQLGIIEAINKISDVKAVIPLLNFIKHSTDTHLTVSAEKAIKNISISSYRLNDKFALELDRSSCDNEADELNISDIFIQALSDKNEYVRRIAAEVLGSLGNNHFIDLIIKAWKQQKISSWVLINILSISSSNKHLSLLKEILKKILIKGPQSDRSDAVKALKKLGWSPSDLNEQIYSWMGEEEWNKIAELDKVAYEPFKEAFQECIIGSRLWRTDAKISIIKAIGDARNVYLDEFIHDEYSNWSHNDLVKRAMVETLGKLSTNKALDTLVLAINDSDYWVRIKAIEKLAEVGYKPAENTFVKVLCDKSSGIRNSATEALDKLGWEPKQPNSLYYYIEKNNSEEVLKFGESAVDKLIEYIREFNPTNKTKLFVMNILCDLHDLRAAQTILMQLSSHVRNFDSWRYIPSNVNLKKIFGDYTDIIVNTLSYAKYDNPKLGERKSGTFSNIQSDRSIRESDFTESTKFIKQLCAIRTPVANNLLIIMKSRAMERYADNWMYHECVYGYVKDGLFTGVHLGTQQKLSEEELYRRGNPPYNESAYLVKESWYF